MNIYGFMIVKDEADILAQTIQSLLKFGGFRKIFVFDNNSTDDTFEVAKTFTCDSLEVSRLDKVYSDDLKYDMVYSKCNLLTNDDWFAILDGDELYVESQTDAIEYAVKHSFNCVEHDTVQFYFTDREPSFDFDRSKPAIEQRTHYLLNYGEPRIFKYAEHVRLTADMVKKRSPFLHISTAKLMVHHFQYRSAQQLQKRIKNRIENNKISNNWGHVKSSSLTDYIVPAKHLHQYDGVIKTGLPDEANLFKIKDNAAYAMANLNWLKKNNALTQEQLQFFSANRWQRLLKKVW